MRFLGGVLLACLALAPPAVAQGPLEEPLPASRTPCRPTYRLFHEPVVLELPISDVSLRLAVIGCEEALVSRWPPDLRKVKTSLEAQLQTVHPTLLMLWLTQESPKLRKRLVDGLNEVLGADAASDVLVFEGKRTAEL